MHKETKMEAIWNTHKVNNDKNRSYTLYCTLSPDQESKQKTPSNAAEKKEIECNTMCYLSRADNHNGARAGLSVV